MSILLSQNFRATIVSILLSQNFRATIKLIPLSQNFRATIRSIPLSQKFRATIRSIPLPKISRNYYVDSAWFFFAQLLGRFRSYFFRATISQFFSRNY